MSKFYPDQKFQYLVLYLTRSSGRYSHIWSTLGDFLLLETHKAFSIGDLQFLYWRPKEFHWKPRLFIWDPHILIIDRYNLGGLRQKSMGIQGNLGSPMKSLRSLIKIWGFLRTRFPNIGGLQWCWYLPKLPNKYLRLEKIRFSKFDATKPSL